MNGRAATAMVAVVLLASGAAACAAPAATPSVPPDIQATLAWLQEHTMQCREAPNGAGPQRWECGAASVWDDGSIVELHVTIQRAGGGGTRFDASLDATDTVGKELCPGGICDPYTGFRKTGGEQLFGPVAVSYEPGQPIFTITIVIAPGS